MAKSFFYDEVDFILSHNGEIIPIEVKYQHFDRPKISSSLKAFIAQYRPLKGYVLNKDYYGYCIYLYSTEEGVNRNDVL